MRIHDLRGSRRSFLRGATALAGAGLTSAVLRRRTHADEGAPDDNTRFLIVLTANGGASIIDSLLAIRASESSRPETLNVFPDAMVRSVEGTPFRAVDAQFGAVGQIPAPFSSEQSSFVAKHADHLTVATWRRTSVNHFIGQRRAVTGNEAWNGRTLQEAVAAAHGGAFALPNVHLTSGSGFTERGTDASLPVRDFGEPIADPALWPLALDGLRGLDTGVSRSLLARARRLRDQKIDARSDFAVTMAQAPRLRHWRHIRGEPQETLEANDLITKLLLFPEGESYPLASHGLSSGASAEAARRAFPNYAQDPVEAQAALAFLLLRYRVAVTVTLGPSFDVVVDGEEVDPEGGALPPGALLNPPIAFDFSHQSHRSVQAFMWRRVFDIADRLIGLLQSEPYGEGGESLWDRSMIYLATDFGRTKQRPSGAEEFSSGHDLNNGIVVLSPLTPGRTLLGGVDPETGLTFGFDPTTGEPQPGRSMAEAEIYAGLLQALSVDTSGSGLADVRALRRRA